LKKIIYIFFLFVVFFGNTVSAQQKNDDSIPNLISKIDSIAFNNAIGMYEVITQGKVFYISKDYKYVFIGNIIDVINKKNITIERIKEIRKIQWSDLPLSDAIAIKRGDGSHKVSIFTDPDCPFCRKLHEELYKLDNVTIYVFLYPLVQLHPEAKKKSIAIWCSDDRENSLKVVMDGKKINNRKDCTNPIDRNITFGKAHNIDGTPAIIFQSGEVIQGYISADQIYKKIAEGV